jgi:hypothetical protein
MDQAAEVNLMIDAFAVFGLASPLPQYFVMYFVTANVSLSPLVDVITTDISVVILALVVKLTLVGCA